MANVVSGSHVFPPVDLADYIVEFVGIAEAVNFSMGLRILRGRAATQIGFCTSFRDPPSKLTMRRPISPRFPRAERNKLVAEHILKALEGLGNH